MEIDYEIIFTVILLLPLIQEGLLPATSDVHEVLVNSFSQACPGKISLSGSMNVVHNVRMCSLVCDIVL